MPTAWLMIVALTAGANGQGLPTAGRPPADEHQPRVALQIAGPATRVRGLLIDWPWLSAHDLPVDLTTLPDDAHINLTLVAHPGSVRPAVVVRIVDSRPQTLELLHEQVLATAERPGVGQHVIRLGERRIVRVATLAGDVDADVPFAGVHRLPISTQPGQSFELCMLRDGQTMWLADYLAGLQHVLGQAAEGQLAEAAEGLIIRGSAGFLLTRWQPRLIPQPRHGFDLAATLGVTPADQFEIVLDDRSAIQSATLAATARGLLSEVASAVPAEWAPPRPASQPPGMCFVLPDRQTRALVFLSAEQAFPGQLQTVDRLLGQLAGEVTRVQFDLAPAIGRWAGRYALPAGQVVAAGVDGPPGHGQLIRLLARFLAHAPQSRMEQVGAVRVYHFALGTAPFVVALTEETIALSASADAAVAVAAAEPGQPLTADSERIVAAGQTEHSAWRLTVNPAAGLWRFSSTR